MSDRTRSGVSKAAPGPILSILGLDGLADEVIADEIREELIAELDSRLPNQWDWWHPLVVVPNMAEKLELSMISQHRMVSI